MKVFWPKGRIKPFTDRCSEDLAKSHFDGEQMIDLPVLTMLAAGGRKRKGKRGKGG